MLSSFPAALNSTSAISNPSSTQVPAADYFHFNDQERSCQFSSSFSIRAILSSSPTSPSMQSLPSSISYRQLLLAGDSGPFDYSAQFPHYHCCHNGACAVNWQSDMGRCDQILQFLSTLFLYLFTPFAILPPANLVIEGN